MGWLLPLGVAALTVLGVGLVVLSIIRRVWWTALLLSLFIGLLSTSLYRLSESEVEGRGLYQIEVTDRGEGIITALRDSVGEWQTLRADIRLLSDPKDSLNLVSGDVVTAWGSVWSGNNNRFFKIYKSSIYQIDRSEESPSWSNDLNSWGCKRIERLSLTPNSEAIAKAMLLGRRESLSSELTESYQRSGAAHLLAVSGLHVMILCFIAGRIFLLLHLLPFGFQLRTIAMACAVWFYAMVVGMSPSVERAAIMFMILQFMRLFGRDYRTLSALAIALGVISLCDPRIYFDAGFWLSFIAVLGIVVWVVPLQGCVSSLCTRWFGKWSLLKWVAESVILTMFIGAACSIVTLPIISWLFGYVSPIGVLLNPIVVVTAYVLLLLTFVWCAVCGWWVAPLFRWSIEGVAMTQNFFVEYAASKCGDSFDVQINGTSVILIYVIYILLTLLLYEQRDKKNRMKRS